MNRSRIVLSAMAFVISVQFALAQPSKSGLPPNFDAFVTKVLQTFEVPGASIAIVKDGKIVSAKGYGIKKLGKTEAVDANTLFLIASNSKAFTASALAILVEEGKIKWDNPVVEYLPWFKMSDPYVTANITVRDLLVHHSGIPAYAGDLMLFPPSDYSRKEIVRRIRHIPLVRGFRTTYAYDNILYLAAGELIKAVSGMEWEDFIKNRIFDKIGMTGSTSRFSDFKKQSNISAAHFRNNGRVTEMKQVFETAIGDVGDPAGGIASNANDMAKWLITQLDSGRAMNKKIIFKPDATDQLWKVVVPIPVSKVEEPIKPAKIDFYGYALGLRAYNYGKYKVVGHGGKLDGFVSQVAMVPDIKLGIAVFTNQEATGAYWSVIYHLLDYYMDNPLFDWTAGFKQLSDSSMIKLANGRKKNTLVRDGVAAVSLPLEKYAGNYRDDLCGDFTITKEAAGLVLQFDHSPQIIADLTPFHHDTFIAHFRNKDFKGDSYVTFALNPDTSIDQVKLTIIDPDSDLNFSNLLLKPVKEKEKLSN